MNFVASFLVFLGLLHSSSAFSTGAGRCVVGEPAPQGFHPNPLDGGGLLVNGGYTITLNGNVISTSDRQPPTVVVDELFQIGVEGPDFKGFLIMLADQPEGALVGNSPAVQQATTGTGCAGTASVTHTSNDLKQSVFVNGTVSEERSSSIHINIVVSNDANGSLYYYTQLPLLVMEAPPSASPTLTPLSEAPTVIPSSLTTTITPTAPEITTAPNVESPGMAIPERNVTETPSGMNGMTLVPSSLPETAAPTVTPTASLTGLPSSTPSTAPIKPMPELTGAPTQVPFSAQPTPPPLQDGDEICDEGFIMDNYCLALGFLLDNNDVVTLESPELHSLHCLLDVSVCWQSNYTMLREPAETESLYSVAYEFDASGSGLLRDLGQSVGMNGYCTSCTAEEDGQEFGFRAVVKGIVVDASAVPPLVNITAVYPSNGTITDEIVAFCNSTGTEPPVMLNVTEVPNATAPPTDGGPDFESSTIPLPEATSSPVTMGPTQSPTVGDTSNVAVVRATGVAFLTFGALVLCI